MYLQINFHYSPQSITQSKNASFKGLRTVISLASSTQKGIRLKKNHVLKTLSLDGELFKCSFSELVRPFGSILNPYSVESVFGWNTEKNTFACSHRRLYLGNINRSIQFLRESSVIVCLTLHFEYCLF